MKRIVILILAIVLTLTPTSTSRVMAEEVEQSAVEPAIAEESVLEEIFEAEVPGNKDGNLSLYGHDIREQIGDECGECNCWGLCYCTQMYHILDGAEQEDFYTAFFEEEVVFPIATTVYEDCSYSMEKTFAYEKELIFKNLSSFLNKNENDVEKVFKNSKTGLYKLISSFKKEIFGDREIVQPREVPIIITDLWDTSSEPEFTYDGEIVFCVPYESTNVEGVLHCEDVVNNILNNHSWDINCTTIYVVYLDNIVVEYSNGMFNGEDGHVTIFVP